MGVRLFERSAFGVRPTVYGEKLVEYAKMMLSLTSEAEAEIGAMQGARRGTLHVGAVTSVIRDLLPKALGRFLLAGSDVSVRVNEELNELLYAALLSGTIDIAIMVRPANPDTDEMEFRTLLEVPIDIIADKDHELVNRGEVTLKDLVPYGWIIPPRPEPDRLKLDALFASAGLPSSGGHGGDNLCRLPSRNGGWVAMAELPSPIQYIRPIDRATVCPARSMPTDLVAHHLRGLSTPGAHTANCDLLPEGTREGLSRGKWRPMRPD